MHKSKEKEMNGISIIPAINYEIETILEIEKESYPKSIYSADTFTYYMRYLPEGFFVISVNREAAGYILFENTGHLISIVVKKKYRRMGLGKRLLSYALCMTGGKLWLEVRTSNTGAIKFYEKVGFKKVDEVPGYYGNESAIIMRYSKDRE